MMKTKTGMKCSVIVALAAVQLVCGKISAQEVWGVDRSKPVATIDQVGAGVLPAEIAPIKAPFDMPQLQKPVFPALTFDISKRGAKAGVNATKVIQKAIDDVSKRGGGTVLVPAGVWQTSRLTLKSNVNLHLATGAELHFGGRAEDFLPAVFTRVEGIEVMSSGGFIYANGAENIAVTGKGKIVGPPMDAPVRTLPGPKGVVEVAIDQNSPVETRVYDGVNGHFFYKPKVLCLVNCKNVLIEEISIEKCVTWNIVPIYCDGVIIRGISVESVGIPTGDGIDIESSRNVLIEYSTLSCGDDCFTLKSGRDQDGRRVNRPTENIVVRYCLARRGHGAITCGSETAGFIRNVYLHDCVFDGTDRGIRFKTRRPRGGGGENLYFERIRMTRGGCSIEWDLLGSATYVGELAARTPLRAVNELTPSFSNTFIRDLDIESTRQFIVANCIPEMPLTNVLIENVKVNTGRTFRILDVKDFTLRNIQINAQDKTMEATNAQNLKFENVTFNFAFE